MSSDWLIGLEMLFVLGLVLAFGGWQLWTVRRSKDDPKDDEKERED